MTQDFRQPGPTVIESATGQPPAVERGRRIVIMALFASAIVFFCAGLWLMTMEQPFISADLVPMLGPTLILVAICDVIAARFLKWFWARQSRVGRNNRRALRRMFFIQCNTAGAYCPLRLGRLAFRGAEHA
jgi:hypothetical protein